MFDINSTVTRRNGVRRSGTLLPQLPENYMYEVYQGLDKIRHGTLYLFLNRYDPAATMREVYGFDEELTNFIISKLTHVVDIGDRHSDTYRDEFDFSPSKAAPHYDYNGYGFYTERFQGTIVPVMYHWISFSNDSLIVERYVRVNEGIIDDAQRYRRTASYGIPDDVVINNLDITSSINVSFEGQPRVDKMFTYPANTVSILSPTPCAKNFNGVVSRYVDSDDLCHYRDQRDAELYERRSAINAHDFYKHYVA